MSRCELQGGAAYGAAPSKQQRGWNAMAARGRRYQLQCVSYACRLGMPVSISRPRASPRKNYSHNRGHSKRPANR